MFRILDWFSDISSWELPKSISHLDAFAKASNLDPAIFKDDIKEKYTGKKLILFFLSLCF